MIRLTPFTDEFDEALRTPFLNRISTHKLKAIAEQLIGCSPIVQITGDQPGKEQTNPIEDKYDSAFIVAS